MRGRSRRASSLSAAQLKEALAALISSTRSKQRPLSLTQISKWLSVAFAQLGSYRAVSERVGLSGKMLAQFAAVDRLTKDVRKLFETRVLDSVDAAVHLAMLAPKDQGPVAHALAKNAIDTMDVRAVVQLRGVRKSEGIERLLTRIQKTKTQRHYVMEFVARETKDREKLVAIFKKYVKPSDIINLEIDGAFGRLVLSLHGKKQLERVAGKLGVPFKSVIQKILSDTVWQK
jgi:hypothetical protein